MKFEISSIADAGDLSKERVILRAAAEGDIGRYAIFKSTGLPQGKVASGSIAGAYWFMDKQISAGDFVVLYSKAGARSEKKNEGGTTSHFFYWGMSEPLWKGNNVPVLVETSTWKLGPRTA